MITLFIFSSASLFTSNCIKTKPFYRQVWIHVCAVSLTSSINYVHVIANLNVHALITSVHTWKDIWSTYVCSFLNELKLIAITVFVIPLLTVQ